MVIIRVPPAKTEGDAALGICGGIVLTIIGIALMGVSWSWGLWFLIFGISVIIWGASSYSDVASRKSYSPPSYRSAPSAYHRYATPPPRYYPPRQPAPRAPVPAVNILRPQCVEINEEGDCVIVTLDLPRASKDSIQVEITGRQLMINADAEGF